MALPPWRCPAAWRSRLCDVDAAMCRQRSRLGDVVVLAVTSRLLQPPPETFFKASALWADAFYKSICPSVRLSVCLFVCLFTFEVPFNGLFAPTSWSRMSNIFRDSESLGESNGKKWSQIWTFLFEKLSKIATQIFFSSLFSLLRYHLRVFLPPLPKVGCPIFLEIQNPWGKSSGKKWCPIWTFLFENCLFAF